MWFRRDLRVSDNKALYHALKHSEKLILLFQINPQQFITDSYNHRAFFSSLNHFKKELDNVSHLQVLFGDPLECFQKLKREVPEWNSIFWNEDTTGYAYKRDQDMRAFFNQENIEIFSYQDAYLHGPDDIKKANNDSYQVFTPYYKKWIDKKKELPLKVEFDSAKVDSNTLFLDHERIYDEFIAQVEPIPWLIPGEKAGIDRLNRFIASDLNGYHTNRDIPVLDKTSRLSPYLRTGEISIRTVLEQVIHMPESPGKDTFIKELCWRDFYNMIYTMYPNQKQEPIKHEYAYIEWDNNGRYFEQWKNGETGYPIVDAAMRQLKTTGWMHNRLRMITASFLVKDLLIDWRYGERYFKKMLVDYDPASNIGGWQWSASTGTDAVPYFRIFNPTKQGQTFDPEGNFIRQYVKELENIPNVFIHTPEKMSLDEQLQYGIILGQTYPYPIINHQERRKKALLAYESSKDRLLQ